MGLGGAVLLMMTPRLFPWGDRENSGTVSGDGETVDLGERRFGASEVNFGFVAVSF